MLKIYILIRGHVQDNFASPLTRRATPVKICSVSIIDSSKRRTTVACDRCSKKSEIQSG